MEVEELIGSWTLLQDDRELLANKTGATRLGFAPLLKFFELEARFPGSASHGDQVQRGHRPELQRS